METRWLNLFLRFSGFVFQLKQDLVKTEHWIKAIPIALLLIGAEVLLMVVSVPLFLFVSSKNINKGDQAIVVRRKLSLFTFGSAVALYSLKILIVGIISIYLLGVTPLLAAIQNWDLSTPANYTYDSAKIDVTGGVAQLKDLGGVMSGATSNSAFTSNATGWTFVNTWSEPSGQTNTGTHQSSGGNPSGYINTTLNSKKSSTVASYWYQAFTTTANNPTTGTLNLDWKSITFNANLLTSYHLYAFIDTTSGNPMLGTEVWDSGNITSTTSWASISTADIKSKIPTAGTYYLKIGAYAVFSGGSGSVGNEVSGWDNVAVNWSASSHSYDTSSPTITPTTSLSMTKTISWNGFTETSTLNGGSISYQLSDDDGATWKYWTGSTWGTAGGTNYNTASVVNTNIGSFPKTNNKIKWKAFLTSNGTQQVILDNVSVAYTENSLPVISTVTPAQGSSTGRIYIPYTLTDADADPESLSAYEYSLTGVFAGEQVTMTPATSDPSHSGVTGLTSSAGGTSHTFVWDAFSQLGAVYNTTVYVRLRANDGVGNGAYAASTAFTVDYIVPTISSVTAAQVAGSGNVSITYTLTDNTSDNNFVELQVSSDGGSTWTVPTSTATGNIGTGQTTGAGKTITWNAGTDFTGHQLAIMKVQVRAKDKYQNQGTYVQSTAFTLDTLAPAILAAVNVQAQPNAGDTTALIGGSFTEVNPNTNDFYVAINGGAYGSATSGTVNTASPANQATTVGSTLNGHDYISSVKIVHTDDFGNVGTNETLSPSTAFKYVKPYTPLAPTLSGPVTTVLDVTINPNVSEASDVQYAILETTTNQYVQANGSLGASAVWEVMGTASGQWGNGTGVSGKVHVTGLSSPVANYIFKVKSRNPNDAAHAASSESAFSGTAQITNTAPTITFGTIAQTTDGTDYVDVHYTGTDAQSDVNSLTSFQYSTDNTTWHTMTEKSGVGSSGTTNLVFASAGSLYLFAWDVGTDLANTESDTVKVRLISSDTLASSTTVTSSNFSVDTKVPVVSAVSASQTVGAKTVTINYTLTEHNNATVALQISSDGGSTWTVPTTSATGDVGAGVTPGSKTITWNAGTDYNGNYNTAVQVRIQATDIKGNVSTNVASSNFTVDTHNPVVSNVTAVQDAGADTFTFHYDVSEDLGNATVALLISSNGGSTFVVPITSAAGDVGTVTPGTGKTITWNGTTDFNLQEKTTMQIRVTATDQYTNTSNTTSSNFSLDTLAPRVTSVAAVQTLGTTNVVVTYTLADQNSSLVEMDISNDGGSTWTVTNTSVSGDIGSNISAGSKTITWNAGVDYDEHAQANMRVRVRAKDVFNNQSANTQSANFSLDTVNPTVNVLADLQAQPNAGDTSVSIGGSFTETNPDTNNFFVAINVADYGSVSAGTSNTASPANHTTPVGSTLKGNDVIAKVKIVHTDDYGQSTTNENTSPSFKYVKPYTPAAPTVNNPMHGTVDVIVNKNASEADGLEYAIFETSQSKYVQADGTLGASAVWRTISAWGTVTVNGLTTDSYRYQFKTLSRNTSDASHAASSESALSGGTSSANQSPVIALNSYAQTTDGTKYVTIAYTGSDLESENSAIITAEYSTNGTVWHTMTEKSGVGSDGKTGLMFAYTGTVHHFMWDVGIDLANTESSTAQIRLQAHDGTTSGAMATSSTFVVDTKNPVISSVTASQQSNSNIVNIGYTLTDLSNATVVLEISRDAGATWTIPATTAIGNVGSNQTPGSGKSISWNPGVDFSGQENFTMRVRLHATDVFGNAGGNTSSSNFSVDTESPRISNVTASQDAGLNTVTIHYDIADVNTSTVVIDISEDNGSTWGVATSTLSGAIGAGITTGTGKTVTWNAATDFPNREQGGIMIRVRATDAHNNLSGNVSSSVFTVDTLAPAITNVHASQTLGTDSVVFTYDLSDSSSANIALDISNDSGSTWTVTDTSLTGDVGAGQTTGSKTITWNAGGDYANHDTSTMRVRVRGTDPYNNTSLNVSSLDFLLDTKSPVVLSEVDLVSQPIAGSSAATVIGSFTETNPNTNDFFVAIDGGAYSLVSGGDVNTVSPTGHSTPIGATLDGNDYISKVKLIHTDDYGHSVISENLSPSASFKFVKPYTPQAPSVTNPHNTRVDVTIVPNAAETSGLEYAIFETTTGKYVKADGTLGVSAVWRTISAWGTTTVSGLSSPVAQYRFEAKSRNISDASHAASSESDLSPQGFITNTAPVIAITSASQQTASNYALLHYIGTDAQNDTNDLSRFEYSTDNSTWHTMTEKTGVGSDETSNLIFASTGTAFTFAWDIAADLPNTGDSTVYIRLQSSDVLASSNIAESSAFAIDTLGPVMTNAQISQTPGTDVVTFTYDLADSTAANNAVTLLISSDGGLTWTVPTTTASGDLGSNVSAGMGRSILWNAGTDFNNQENSTMQIKLQGIDLYGNTGTVFTSSNFSVDTKGSVISSVSAQQIDGTKTIHIQYALTDFSSGGLTTEFSVSSDNGSTWTVPTVTASGDIGSGQTTGTKEFIWNAGMDFMNEAHTHMRVRVKATDYFGNVSDYTESSVFALDTKPPVISGVTAVQTPGTDTVVIGYELSDDTSTNLTVALQISGDGGLTWNIPTVSTAGNIGASQTTGANKTISWNAATDFTNQDILNLRVRLIPTDTFGSVGTFIDSSDASVDTAAPFGLAELTKFLTTATSTTVSWIPATDTHFDHYELWYGNNESDVQGRTGTATKWGVIQDATLANHLTNSTVISGVVINQNFYVKIWAIDSFGHETTIDHINVYTPPAPPVPVQVSGGGGVCTGSGCAPVLPVLPDTTAPVAPILSPVASVTNNTRILVSGLSEQSSTIMLFDNGTLFETLTSKADTDGVFAQTLTFAEGVHALTAKAIDVAGNQSESSQPIMFTVDQTAPPQPIVLTPTLTNLTSATPLFAGTAEPLSFVFLTIDHTQVNIQADSVGTWTYVVPGSEAISVGSHKFSLQVKDQAGNASPVVTETLSRIAIVGPQTIAPVSPAFPIAPAQTPQMTPSVATIESVSKAVELPGLAVPIVTAAAVANRAGNTFTFRGTSIPNARVAIYIHSTQALLYQTTANVKGEWKLDHIQSNVTLSEGDHSIYAVALDAGANVKSKPGEIKMFSVQKNIWAQLFDYLNLHTTLITLGILGISVLWLFRLKQYGVKHV